MCFGLCLVWPLAAQEGALIQGKGPGTLTVEFSNGNHYWNYQITPEQNSVRLSAQGDFKPTVTAQVPSQGTQSSKPLGPSLTCEKSPRVTSPDGKFVAGCRVIPKKIRDHFEVTNGTSSTPLYEWGGHSEFEIDAIAWSPDSQWVALLHHSERYGKDPLSLFVGLSGHPIPHSSVFLLLFNVCTGVATEYLVEKDVKYLLYPTIVSWTE